MFSANSNGECSFLMATEILNELLLASDLKQCFYLHSSFPNTHNFESGIVELDYFIIYFYNKCKRDKSKFILSKHLQFEITKAECLVELDYFVIKAEPKASLFYVLLLLIFRRN